MGIIEFHDAGGIITELQYDSIYHEHLCYFSIKSMTYLLNLFKLKPFHIEKSPITGGSWVIYFSKNGREQSTQLEEAIIEENENINSIVVLRENSVNGTDLAFKATINTTKTKITIDPDSLFNFEQTYYYGMAGVIEDSSNNPLPITGATF